MSVKGRAVIVGASESSRIGVLPDMSALELHAESARLALADAGLTIKDVDGVASAGISPVTVAHHIGIKPAYIDYTSIGGGSLSVIEPPVKGNSCWLSCSGSVLACSQAAATQRRCQGGAPAAKRGRTTFTPVRTAASSRRPAVIRID